MYFEDLREVPVFYRNASPPLLEDKIRSIRNLPTLPSPLNRGLSHPDFPDEITTRDNGSCYIFGKHETEMLNGTSPNSLIARPMSPVFNFTGAEDDFNRHSAVGCGSHSVECFFGRITSLELFYKLLYEKYPSNLEDFDKNGNPKNGAIKPTTIKKLLLVGHPLDAFTGLNRFIKLTEVWITDCLVTEGLWSDFVGLKLHRLYLYNNRLKTMEPLAFENLRVLWINGNKLTSLEFLNQGIPTLEELNLAQNSIGCFHAEDFIKCTNLRTLNVSGNPLHTLEDVLALKTIPNLQVLSFADPVYGKSPIAAKCDSRTMLISIFSHLSSLDGKGISEAEIDDVKEYVESRGFYFYASSVRVLASQSVFRRTTMISTIKKLESLSFRLEVLLSLISQYRRIISSVQVIPIFPNAKNLMKEQVLKIEHRVGKLIEWAAISLRRLMTVMDISRWEQGAEKWIKWIEFQSFGNTQSHMIHSVHGPLVGQPNELCLSLHELISSLTCPELWPHTVTSKVETVIVIRDIGMETGLQRTYEEHFAPNYEPKFIQPDETGTYVPPSSNGGVTASNPVPPKLMPVTTYLEKDWKPNPPLHSYPDSIVGLPEKALPVFLLLVCPLSYTANPLGYFYKIVNDKAIHYKEIRLTNCLWHVLRNNVPGFATVIIVKVLKEAVQLVSACKKDSAQGMSKHSFDCGVFRLKVPQALAPAYILTLTFTPREEKGASKLNSLVHDGDIVEPAKVALTNIIEKIVRHGHITPLRPGQSKQSQFLRKGPDGGVWVDLSATLPHMTKDGDLLHQIHDWSEATFCNPPIQSIAKFFGADISLSLTSVDLSGNKLGMLIGLEGLMNLKKLNLSHNKLSSIASLNRFPLLLELKLGWNSLRQFHSTGLTLRICAPRLLTLDILPNPFQDIREFGHIPTIMRRLIPTLNRIDDWMGRTTKSGLDIPPFIPNVREANLNVAAMSNSWGSCFVYKELAGKCLVDLELMPETPQFSEGMGTDGMELDLSNNYLTSRALVESPFVRKPDWRTTIIKMELQENNIASLDWIEDHAFLNLQVLNLARNMVTDLHLIPGSCPALRHLILCGNPLPCDSGVLFPLRLLKNLITLDCTGTPVTSHCEYSFFVTKHLSSLKILDGIPMVKWQIIKQVDNSAGIVTQDWLEDKLGFGNRDWSALTQLSLPNSNLQKITLPGNVLPQLMTLNLRGNNLSTFSSLSTLPNLRVLCMSHNKVSSLGSNTCPTCFSNTVHSQWNLSPGKVKPLFPKLEVLILAHNELSSLNDLHLHSMPKLHTLLCNCNSITTLRGLESLSTITAVVLDKNELREVPFNSLIGCQSLRYLHLEHNRLTAVPRLPHLTALTALHLGYNKIQNITDLSCLSSISELSLTGNAVSRREDYRFRVAACLPFLSTLDGRHTYGERQRLQETSTHWVPAILENRNQNQSHPISSERAKHSDGRVKSNKNRIRKKPKGWSVHYH